MRPTCSAEPLTRSHRWRLNEWDEGAAAAATLVNAAKPSEVIIGPSTTMLLHTLANCMSQTLKEGDEIIVTDCDHESNIGPWLKLSDHGVAVKFWNINPDSLALELEDLDSLMTDRTRLVAVTHTSNILGSIFPIRDITRFVHSRGSLICVDGVAFAPHRRVDVQELEVDFYAMSFYKLFGPHQAMLFGKHDELLRLPGMNHYFVENDEVPYKFQPGNVNYELSYSLTGIVDYLNEFAVEHGLAHKDPDTQRQIDSVFDCISRHEERLAERLLAFLRSRSNVRIIGNQSSDRAQRVPTISFTVDDRLSSEIPPKIDTHRIGDSLWPFLFKEAHRWSGVGVG